MRRIVLAAVAGAALAACDDPAKPVSPEPTLSMVGSSAPAIFQRYVAMGTSNSMGVQSAGVVGATQLQAWPAQLARRVPAPFTTPLIQEPGCGPLLRSPLILAPVLFAISDLFAGIFGSICAPLAPGIVPPTNNVAISGATAAEALTLTPEGAAAQNPQKGRLYSRVLAPSQTQVTAMLAQSPTFVSVELAANEVLRANSGKLSSLTPFPIWRASFDQIVDQVRSTGAKGMLVGLPNDATAFPSVRRGWELYAERFAFFAFYVNVSSNCRDNQNVIFVPFFVFKTLAVAADAAARGLARPVMSCADVPGAEDHVLTPADAAVINAQLAQMNAHIQQRAVESGYAYFSLNALYGLPKPRFSLLTLLTSSAPFGPYISLDGVHPTAAGQTILANAAVAAINARYGLSIQ